MRNARKAVFSLGGVVFFFFLCIQTFTHNVHRNFSWQLLSSQRARFQPFVWFYCSTKWLNGTSKLQLKMKTFAMSHFSVSRMASKPGWKRQKNTLIRLLRVITCFLVLVCSLTCTCLHFLNSLICPVLHLSICLAYFQNSAVWGPTLVTCACTPTWAFVHDISRRQ